MVIRGMLISVKVMFILKLEMKDDVVKLCLAAVEQYFLCDGARWTCKVSTPTPKSVREIRSSE